MPFKPGFFVLFILGCAIIKDPTFPFPLSEIVQRPTIRLIFNAKLTVALEIEMSLITDRQAVSTLAENDSSQYRILPLLGNWHPFKTLNSKGTRFQKIQLYLLI